MPDTDYLNKPTKAGVAAALIAKGFTPDTLFPPALRDVPPADTFSIEEMEWAEYLIADTDFGGAWNDADQINFHLA